MASPGSPPIPTSMLGSEGEMFRDESRRFRDKGRVGKGGDDKKRMSGYTLNGKKEKRASGGKKGGMRFGMMRPPAGSRNDLSSDDDEDDEDDDDEFDEEDDDYDYDYDEYDDENVKNGIRKDGVLGRNRGSKILFDIGKTGDVGEDDEDEDDEDDDDDDDDDTALYRNMSEDDTLTTVFENEFSIDNSDSDLLSDFGIRESGIGAIVGDDGSHGGSISTGNGNTIHTNRHIKDRTDSTTSGGLSSSVPVVDISSSILTNAMSEEDDSNIEEELQYAARQIKRKTLSTDVDSFNSEISRLPSEITTRPPSETNITSFSQSKPRVRATTVGTSTVSSAYTPNHKRMIMRQRSLDIGLNTLASNRLTNIGSNVSSSSRRMSNPPPPVRTLSSRTINTNATIDSKEPLHVPAVSRRNTDASISAIDLIPEIFPSDEVLSKQNFYQQTSKSATNSSINLVNSLAVQAIPSNMPPPPQSPPPPPPITKTPAKLSILIKAKQSSFDNPLEQYIAASGKSERKPCHLKMYMPSCNDPKSPWEVIVRTDANVASAIGFALYCYQQQSRLPALTEDKCDANKWNLRIVEDDGEPDEDFPALDRTRLISAYSFDEFALVSATPEQFRENERITPNSRKPSVKSTDILPTTSSTSKSKSKVPPETNPTIEEVTLRIFQFPFNELVSPLFWTATLPITTKIEDVLDSICQDKVIDINMYLLKIAGTRILAINSLQLSSLEGRYNLELTPKRTITAENGYDMSLLSAVTRKSSSLSSNTVRRRLAGINSTSSQNIYSALENRGAQDFKTTSGHNRLPSSILPEGLLNGASAGYQKYMIWRRQPMSFISRHERVLAIDGEYVHIMPSEDRTFFDSPKTSSFHIGQIIKCKQSNKVPTNFKVVVMKTNGPKRYDLEAVSMAESAEIVTKLRALSQKYRKM